MGKVMKVEADVFSEVKNLALLYDPDVTLTCAHCGEELEILRLSAKKKDTLGRFPPYLVRCPTSERHFHVEFHHRPSEDDVADD